MDLIQFSLFFVALLIGYALVHVRLLRCEQHLREIAGIRTLNQRLEAVATGLERVRIDRVEELLQLIHEDLRAVHRATTGVEEALGRMPAQAPGGPTVVPASPGERLLAVVETSLLQLGYQNLRVLGDLSRGSADGDTEVLVECERSGMPCKGRVVLRNGRVRDVQIQSAAQTFP